MDNLKGITKCDTITYAYNASTKCLMVGPYWDGDISGTAFPEEIVHYLQDNLYENGIGQYFRGAMSNIEFEAKLNQKLEIGFGCSGRLNYTCVVLDDSEISLKLYKNDRKGFTIDKKICKIKLDNFNYVKLTYDDSKLFVNVNNQEFIFDCIVEKGALVFNVCVF